MRKSNLATRDTSKYHVFHGTHGHYTSDYKSWKRPLEELVKGGHCTEFVTNEAFQQIEDCDVAKEPPQKGIRIHTVLGDSEESGMTYKEKKRKIK